jgi:phenol 2-monooxygenase
MASGAAIRTFERQRPTGVVAVATSRCRTRWSQFPAIETMIVERMSGNIIKGKADGINTRTMEMFQAFGFADKVKRETYWVNQTAFWMPDPKNPEHIKRVGRVQDVADDSSEMPHILINQARLHELFLEVMKNSPSRLEPDYGWEIVGLTIDDTIDDHPVTVTLKDATGCDGHPGQHRFPGCASEVPDLLGQ